MPAQRRRAAGVQGRASRPSTTAGCSATSSSPGTRSHGVPLRHRDLRAQPELPGARAQGHRYLLRRGRRRRSSRSAPPAGAKVVQVSLPAGAPARRPRRRRHAGQAASPRSPAPRRGPGSPAVQARRARQAGRPSAPVGVAARLGRPPGGAGHLRPGPRRDRGDRAGRAGRAARPARSQGGTGQRAEPAEVSINGATGQELDTALGTVRAFTQRRRLLHGARLGARRGRRGRRRAAL